MIVLNRLVSRKVHCPSLRIMAALQLVGALVAGFSFPVSPASRSGQPSMAAARASRREALNFAAAAAAFIVASPPRAAFASLDPNDMTRFKKALTGVNYLLDNWDKETTECKLGGDGVCTDQPDKVRYYFGLRTTDHPLFQLDKLYAKAQAKSCPMMPTSRSGSKPPKAWRRRLPRLTSLRTRVQRPSTLCCPFPLPLA